MKSAVLKERNYQFKTNINMKTKTSILAVTKAFFILLVSNRFDALNQCKVGFILGLLIGIILILLK